MFLEGRPQDVVYGARMLCEAFTCHALPHTRARIAEHGDFSVVNPVLLTAAALSPL